MNKRICASCKKEFISEGNFCPLCGEKLDMICNDNMDTASNQKKKNKKKIIIGITSGILLIASVTTVTVLYLTSPIVKFQKVLINQNYEEAKKILTQDINENSNEYTKAKKKTINIMENTLDDYASGKNEYDECKNLEKFISVNFSDVNCEDYEKLLALLKTSKDNYNNAEFKKKGKEYLDAVSYYEKVSEKDIEHYESAKEKIQICKDEYKNQIIDEINKQKILEKPENGYLNIADKISKTDWLEDDNEVLQELTKLNEVVKNSVISNVDKLSSKKMYTNAIEYINANLPTVYLKSNEIEEKVISLKKMLVKDITQKADKYIAKGNLDNAKKVLSENIDYDIENILQKKLNNINKKIKKKALSEFRTLKQQVTIGYDDVDKDYSIAGKGYSTEYVNVSQSVNIEAKMYVDKNKKSATFFLVFGFEQDDWIFTERIKIVSGKYSTEFSVDYLDRQTQVFLGGIAEWVMMVDTSSFDQFYNINTPSLDSDLIDAIDVITSSKKVTIRFSGKGKRDHIITDSEKKNIKNIRRMYELLQMYPEFFNEF